MNIVSTKTFSFTVTFLLKYLFLRYVFLFHTFFLSLAAPSAPPDNVASSKTSSTSLKVQFGDIPFLDRNGIISHYEVRIRQVGVDPDYTIHTVQEVAGAKSIEIFNLQKWRDYEYVVAGCTAGGCGTELSLIHI